MKTIDLRSDTVTLPDEAMKKAMYNAPVGDDGFSEDPTVILLQEKASELLKKKAALFVPSGIMGNQICLRLLTQHGDEVICDSKAHLYRNEGAAAAVLSGLSFLPVLGERGCISAKQIIQSIQPDKVNVPQSKVVAIENSHNSYGGAYYRLDAIENISEVAKKNRLKLHLDGARMFNACIAGRYKPAELADFFDTVVFCLSKGLGAPAGSLVVSSHKNIQKAIRIRKQFGGGMRQIGSLAAAGLYALDNNMDRLFDDNTRAKKLAYGLAEMKGISLDPNQVETNIIVFDISPSGLEPAEAVVQAENEGIRLLKYGTTVLRAVCHLGINDNDIEMALSALSIIFDKTI